MDLSLNNILKIIENYDNIVISAHISPDGDAYGSIISLKKILESKYVNKKIYLLLNDNLLSYLEVLGFKDRIYKSVFDIPNFEKNKFLLISLDTATYDRIAILKNEISLFREHINIDHHISNSKYAKYNYVEEISSVSELNMKILDELNVYLTKDIAKWIYLGIINDTGNFRHSNVTKNTFLVASRLIETGINISEIYFALFTKNHKKTKIFGRAMIDYKYDEEYKFASYFISNDEIEKNKYNTEDMDGISELLLTIKDIDIALFIKEEIEGKIKGSFRSKKIDVSKMANDLFGGGGHKLAAGFVTDKSSNQIVDLVYNYLRRNL